MGRIVEGQIITTTHVDSHGERLSREEIVAMFSRRSPQRAMGNNHNLARLPIARSFNDRLEELPDGELAWKVDVEVFDEDAFAQFGGVSIAFTRRHVRLGKGDVVAKLTLNTRQFDYEAAVDEVNRTVARRHVVEVVEKVEKADVVTVAIIAITSFVGAEIAGGFFKAIGASLFEAAKKLRRKDIPSGAEAPSATVVHFHFHLDAERKTPMLLLAVDPECTVEDIRDLTENAVLDTVSNLVPLNRVGRAAAIIRRGGRVELQYATNENGEIIYRKDGNA
jgi:hypothetical protein